MRDLKSQKYPAYLTYELFMSPAFRHLKPAARDILIQVFYEIKFASKKKRNQKYAPVVANRDEIVLTYQEIKARLGYSEKTIWQSFKQIMAHGFLKVVKHGGGAKGDYQVYGIAEDWRKWTPGEVARDVQQNGKTGWQKKHSKKISSTTGKPVRSTTGKPVEAKTASGLPTGKAVSA